MDSAGTVSTSDDTVPDWSTRRHRRPARRRRRPGCLGAGAPRARAAWRTRATREARVGDRFARASGTSQATAVAAGEAALILQKYPWLTPDQVKQLMTTTASGILSTLPIFGGSGLVNLRAVLTNPLNALLGTVGGLLDSLVGHPLGIGHRLPGEGARQLPRRGRARPELARRGRHLRPRLERLHLGPADRRRLPSGATATGAASA